MAGYMRHYLGLSFLGFERRLGDYLTCLSCATEVLDFVYSSETSLTKEANSNVLRVTLLVYNDFRGRRRSNLCVLSRQGGRTGPLSLVGHRFLFLRWGRRLLVMMGPAAIVDVGERVSLLLGWG